MRGFAFAVVGLCALGCGSESEPASQGAAKPALAHTFPVIAVDAGEETDALCQQWTPGHAETLHVNAIKMKSGGGFHHMNFFFVPESLMEGPDGTFTCADRGYNLQLSAVAGGVFYAQSTQANEELMQFAEGAVIRIPPGHKIVGNLHILNTAPSPIDAELTFELFTIPEAEVTARLTGYYFQYGQLEIQPQARSEFSVECDWGAEHLAKLGRPLDLDLHYLLPHYHALGDLLRFEVVGGPRDGEILAETETRIGEPVGKTFDPPLDLTGVGTVRLTCGFDNPGTDVIGWGIGKNEMCIAVGFSDSEYLWSGGSTDATHESLGSVDGVAKYQAGCSMLSAPSSAAAP